MPSRGHTGTIWPWNFAAISYVDVGDDAKSGCKKLEIEYLQAIL